MLVIGQPVSNTDTATDLVTVGDIIQIVYGTDGNPATVYIAQDGGVVRRFAASDVVPQQ